MSDARWILEVALQATALLAFGALASFVLDRSTRGRVSAATQHFLWLATFTAVVALVPLRALVPAQPMLPAQPLVTDTYTSAETAAVSADPVAVGASDTSALAVVAKTPVPWSSVVVGAWFLGALLALVRLGVGFARSWRLVRRSRPHGTRRGVPVRITSDLTSPVVTGLLRPVILVPTTFPDWPSDRAHAALEHELAHVRRMDLATTSWVEACAALLWFHPLAWLGKRRFAVAREQACDDAVVISRSRDEFEFASDLVAIARVARSAHHAVPAPACALGMASRPQLEERIASLVDPARARAERCTVRSSIGLAAAFIAATMLIAPLSAKHSSPSDRAISEALAHGAKGERIAGLRALFGRATRADYARVAMHAYDADPDVRATTLRVLEDIGCMPAMLVTVHALDDPDARVRHTAIRALQSFEHPRWWDAREAAMRPHIWGGTLRLTDRALRARRVTTCRDRLTAAARSHDEFVRARAAAILAAL